MLQKEDGLEKKIDKRKLLARAKYIALGVVILIVLAILGTGVWYQIEEQEEAVVVTLGEAKAVSEKGLHFKIPLLQQVRKVDTTIQGFPIGYDITTKETVDDEAVMITSDYNFINVNFFVEYRISDPVKYLYASDNPEGILKNIAQSCIRTVIGSYDVDSVLTTGKAEIQAAIKQMILDKLENQDIGLDLVNITIQDSEPPTKEIMQAFKAVETAKQGKDTALNNANKYRNEKLPGLPKRRQMRLFRMRKHRSRHASMRRRRRWHGLTQCMKSMRRIRPLRSSVCSLRRWRRYFLISR